MKPNRKADLPALLQTKNKSEQAKRVQNLLAAETAPVVDIVLRADYRFPGEVGITVIGTAQLNFGDAIAILEAALAKMQGMRIEAAMKEKIESGRPTTDG
jgi:hypothetical protein